MPDTKLVHIQDESFFLVKVVTRADYDSASIIRERIRDREEEVDQVYAPIQARQKKQVEQLKTDRQKTALERASWLVVHDNTGNRHDLASIDEYLKSLMSKWATKQHRDELKSKLKFNKLLLKAQEDMKAIMLTEAAGDPDLVESIQETPFLSAPPAVTERQPSTTLNVDVRVIDISRVNPTYLQADLPKIKALAKSKGTEYALDLVGRDGIAIRETLNPRLKPRRKRS